MRERKGKLQKAKKGEDEEEEEEEEKHGDPSIAILVTMAQNDLCCP